MSDVTQARWRPWHPARMLIVRHPLLATLAVLSLGALAAAPNALAYSSVTPTVHTVSPDANTPDIAVNDAGETIAAYVPGNGTGQAFVRRLAPDGQLGPELAVSADGQETFGPTVILTPGGRAFSAWRNQVGTNSEARGRWIEADGTRGPILTLGVAGDTGAATDRDVVSLDAVLGTDGHVTVSWVNADVNASASQNLELRRVTPAGAMEPAAGPLSNVSLGTSVTNPVAAALPGGATAFVWRSAQIRATVVAANEALPVSTTQVSTTGLSADPSLAVDGLGRITVAWRRSENDQYAVSARRLDATGAVLGTVFNPSPLADGFVRVATPVTVTAAGEALFAWGRQPTNDAILTVRSRTEAGVLGAAELPLSDPAQNADGWAIAHDGLGSAYAAWDNQNEAPETADLQPLAITGAPIGPVQVLDSATSTRIAGMALGNDGVGAVALQRFDGSNAILLRQLIPPPGGCTDTGAATTAPAAVAITVTCSGVQARAQVLTQPAGGSVAEGPGTALTYTPRTGFSGTDSFTVRAVNTAGATGGTATVTVTVGAAPAAPAGPAGPAASGDTTRPVISKLSLSRRRFTAGGRGAQVSAVRRTPAGTALRFTLSERAKVRVTVSRALPGRVKGGRCAAPTKATAKARRCTRLVARGSLVRELAAGPRSIAFNGKRRGRALAAGRYRLTLQATDAAGNASRAANAWATLVRRR